VYSNHGIKNIGEINVTLGKEDNMYKVNKEDGLYLVLMDEEQVLSPAGNPVVTEKKDLAEMLVSHFNEFGPSAETRVSIAYFHYPLLDFIRKYPRQGVEQQLILGFDPYNDWSLRINEQSAESEKRRTQIFGNSGEQAERGRLWVRTLNEYQLCAAMVLGKTMESMNLAYLASQNRNWKQTAALIRKIILLQPRFGSESLEELFANFLFYYRL
jgi:hypothetical protein